MISQRINLEFKFMILQVQGVVRKTMRGTWVFRSMVIGGMLMGGLNALGGVPSGARNVNRSGVSSVKYDRKAKTGVCIPPLRQNPLSVLQQHNISQKGGKSIEILALARGIRAMDSLASQKVSFVDGLKVKILPQAGFSNYAGNGNINLRRNVRVHAVGRGEYVADNVAHFVHEIGHHIGHQTSKLPGIGKGKNYELYRRYVRGYCLVSRYSTANPNEQFAEVVAAYVTNPNLLNNSVVCRKARQFMQALFNRVNSEQPTCGAYQTNAANLWALTTGPVKK